MRTKVIPLSWSIPTDDVEESFEDGEVMFAVDDGGDDRTTVIADVSNDEAYLAMPYDESHTLSQWR
ncbi:DUF7556 family protein [Halorussus halobius]|uniref:DUF7556 family protein n=1 Tax=Halorussus halobius TaxID=1710537 RepID=UPI001092FACA|nr:hypothetical protein [Halorussus halobius]